jgi:hypothetical protein
MHFIHMPIWGVVDRQEGEGTAAMMAMGLAKALGQHPRKVNNGSKTIQLL